MFIFHFPNMFLKVRLNWSTDFAANTVVVVQSYIQRNNGFPFFANKLLISFFQLHFYLYKCENTSMFIIIHILNSC